MGATGEISGFASSRRGVVVLALLAFSGVFVLSAQTARAACHRFTFDQDVYTIGESGGQVTITVSRDAALAPSAIKYETVDATAKAGQDYTSRSGTLSYTNQISMSFTVPITNDSKDEPSESFDVRLFDPSGCAPNPNYSVDKPSSVRITDNDPKPQASTPSTPTRSSSPKPKTSSSPSPTPTRSASPRQSATPTPTPTPAPAPTQTAAAAADEGSGGLSGGAIAGIIAGAVVVGGAGVFFVRRRLLA